jgi:hypothetical protein
MSPIAAAVSSTERTSTDETVAAVAALPQAEARHEALVMKCPAAESARRHDDGPN